MTNLFPLCSETSEEKRRVFSPTESASGEKSTHAPVMTTLRFCIVQSRPCLMLTLCIVLMERRSLYTASENGN